MEITAKNCQGISDEELVQKSLQDINYFSCIYERYEKRLIRYVLRISSFSFVEAEEVLQEAFVKAWQNLNEFDKSLKLSSWIYRITHNTVITEWKKTQSKGKNKIQEFDEGLFQNLPSKLDLVKNVNQKCDEKNIRKILQFLPLKYREVLILKFLEERSYDEISDILKKPSGTIATLINRAKKSFQYIADQKNISFK